MAVDGEYFGKVLNLARERLYENATKILSGDVEPAPYRRGLENACDFCTLRDACNFDRRLSGYHYRDLKKLAKDEVREKICGVEEDISKAQGKSFSDSKNETAGSGSKIAEDSSETARNSSKTAKNSSKTAKNSSKTAKNSSLADGAKEEIGKGE